MRLCQRQANTSIVSPCWLVGVVFSLVGWVGFSVDVVCRSTQLFAYLQLSYATYL